MGSAESKKKARGILEYKKKMELLYTLIGRSSLQSLLIAMHDAMPETDREAYGSDPKAFADAVRKYEAKPNCSGSDPRNGSRGQYFLKLVKCALEQSGVSHDNLIDVFVNRSYDELAALLPRRMLSSSEFKRFVDQGHRDSGVLPLKAIPSRRPPSIQEMWERGQVDQVLVYYTEEAAENWRNVALHPSYGQYHQCSEALELLLGSTKWSEFCRTKQPDGVVSLGAGSASKDLLVIKDLRKRNDSLLTLTLVDYSPSMLVATAAEITKDLYELDLHDGIEVEPLLGDFMELKPLPSIRRSGTPVVFVIAGGTIGNVNEAELLRAVARCSEPGDWFLVGLETIPDEIKTRQGRLKFERELSEKYDQPYARRLLAPALERIWKLLGHEKSFADAVNDDIVPRPVYGRENGFSMVPKSMSIVFEIIGGTKPVSLLASTRYDEEAFLEFASEFGFTRVAATASKENARYRMLALEYMPRAADTANEADEPPNL